MSKDIDALLTPDCENCQALCCMALALDAGAEFAIDKPAGTACPNLADNNRCRIHENLEARGFRGCIRYSCLGAGQWVSALYGGATWRNTPALSTAIVQDFATARTLREALELVHAARALPLSAAQQIERKSLIRVFTPAPEQTRALFTDWAKGRLKSRHRAFLASLRGLISP